MSLLERCLPHCRVRKQRTPTDVSGVPGSQKFRDLYQSNPEYESDTTTLARIKPFTSRHTAALLPLSNELEHKRKKRQDSCLGLGNLQYESLKFFPPLMPQPNASDPLKSLAGEGLRALKLF